MFWIILDVTYIFLFLDKCRGINSLITYIPSGQSLHLRNTNYGNPAGALCNMGYPSETQLKTKSRKISFAHNLFFSYPIGLKFAESTAVSLPCYVQNVETIARRRQISRTNVISRDLSLR